VDEQSADELLAFGLSAMEAVQEIIFKYLSYIKKLGTPLKSAEIRINRVGKAN